MDQDIAGRLPSRRVLDELRNYLPLADRAATPVARAFVALDAAVTIHAEALARIDRAESRFLTVRSRLGAIEDPGGSRRLRSGNHGPRGPERPGKANSPAEQLRPRGLGSRRRALAVAEAQEARLSAQVRSATDCLLSAQVVRSDDIAFKLAVVIAAG